MLNEDKTEASSNTKKKTLVYGAKKKALLIALIYLVAGVLWILLSDYYGSLLKMEHFIWISLVKGLLYIALTGSLIYFLVYWAMRKIEEAALEAEARESLLKALFDSIPDLIFYKDKDSIYRGCNNAFEDFAGIKEEDLIGKSDSEIFGPDDVEKYLETDRKVFKNNEAQTLERTYQRKDGSEGVFEIRKTPYYNESGEIIGLIGIRRDITERKHREGEIIYLNHHDVLTGLYNRAYVQQALEFIDKKKNLPISVVVGDINGLKLINDSFGHEEGDRLIIAIGEILKASVRDTDIVARVGGDEFYLILPNMDSDGANRVIEDIRKACDIKSQDIESEVHFTSVSLGQASKVESGLPLSDYINVAEEYMYQQKTLDFKSFHSSLLISIKNTMYEKSYETEQHAERLAQQSLKLGQLMNMSSEELDALQLFATVHDIGKITIDQHILTKEDELTEDDWRELRKHPETGYRIAITSPGLMHVAEFILCHHEWWDGSGYPRGLKEEESPLASRILAVVDAFDAMTHDRAYRKARSKEEAIEELVLCSGSQFDPHVVKLFVENVF